jgi:hypothetical protein
MSLYTISDNTIKKIKKKHLLLNITTVIIAGIVLNLMMFFVLNDNDVFFPSLGLFVVIMSITVFFSLRVGLKNIEKALKGIQYSIDDEKLTIRNSDSEQYNILKDYIKSIDKNKKDVIIILKNGKKIHVNKNLENIDDLTHKLERLSANQAI